MFLQRKLVFAFLLFISVFTAVSFAQEDEDWYMDRPITKITFKGLQSVKSSDLSGLTSSYVGQKFQDCFYDLLNRLEALNYFEEISPGATHDSGSGVILVLTVKERPVISSIKFKGNKKVRNPPLREALTIKIGNVYSESDALVDERALRDVYLDKGFSSVKISHTAEKTDAGIAVTFHIKEGNSICVVGVNFEGNAAFSSKKLKKQTKLKTVNLFSKGAFKESQLEIDRQAISKYYMDRGYLDFHILDVTRDVVYNEKKDRDEMTITYFLYEGSIYTFDGMTITGNRVFSSDRLNALISLKKGDVFNATQFQGSLMAISDLYYENGYTENSFNPAENRDSAERKVSYNLTITERDRSHVEKVIVKGNEKTKDFVITRELPIESGDVFSKAKITNGLRNLYNLQYFSSVVPSVEPGSDANLVNLIISVEEQQTNSIEFGITFSGVKNASDLPFSLFAKWSNSNLLGLGKTISVGTTISTTEQSVSLGYSQRWLWDKPIEWSENISFSHAKTTALRLYWTDSGVVDSSHYYMEYERWQVNMDHSLAHRWMPNWAILTLAGGFTNSITNYIYDNKIYTPVDLGISRYANNWGFTNSIWTKWSMDGRDINYDPSKGWFFSERLAWFGLLPIETDFYFRSDTKLEGYLTLLDIPFSEKWSFKIVFAALTTLSFQAPAPGSSVSDIHKLYVDGMFNGRGWTEIYSNVKGKAMISQSLEIRIPIVPRMFALDGFFDAVAVKEDLGAMISNVGLNDFYFSFGPDIRILMPQFPLRLLLANCFRIQNGTVKWGDTWKFVLSFNLVNK
ncbi:MAG: outer membrane protein assembly factor BamA [Treponema sp.]|nr:outer membrane protein assembly factor BamA [Treponema sp.]